MRLRVACCLFLLGVAGSASCGSESSPPTNGGASGGSDANAGAGGTNVAPGHGGMSGGGTDSGAREGGAGAGGASSAVDQAGAGGADATGNQGGGGGSADQAGAGGMDSTPNQAGAGGAAGAGSSECTPPCVNQACIDGGCVGTCAPGGQRCSNDGVQVCLPSGNWGAASACPDGACLDGACTCPAAVLGQTLGHQKLLLGGRMENATFTSAQFDLRYVFIVGDGPATPCTKCDASCGAALASWWGCWGNSAAGGPGQYVTDHITATRAHGAIPMLTYYRWYSVAGKVENAAAVTALNNVAKTSAFFKDFQFFMHTVGQAGPQPVLVHLEPDLWGFVEQVNHDPTLIPAKVSTAGIPSCAALPDTAAGYAKCLLAIGRAEAPNAILGFHASAWGDGVDVLANTNSQYDVAAHADRTATFLRALGAAEADMVVVEMSNHDAGQDNSYWDATDVTLPSFAQATTWAGRLGQQLGLPPLWWQVPYGNMALSNATCGQYRDNRVAYVFDHPERFAAIGSIGVAFGAALACSTTDTTDGGYFLTRAQAYFSSASRPCLCGACP